jgi:hypothetical protein
MLQRRAAPRCCGGGGVEDAVITDRSDGSVPFEILLYRVST